MFIARYVVHHNATLAYQQSHPHASRATADTEGPKLSKDPRIASEIKRAIADIVEKSQHTAKKVLDEIARIAFANIQDYYGPDGNIIPPHDLPRELAAGAKKIERVEIKRTDAGGNLVVVGHTVKLDLSDKLAALLALGKHYGLFNEKNDVGANQDLATLIREGRERVIAARIREAAN